MAAQRMGRFSCVGAACVVAAMLSSAVSARQVAGHTNSGDGRGLATFGDRGLESFGTRPLESIGPIPLTPMGGTVEGSPTKGFGRDSKRDSSNTDRPRLQRRTRRPWLDLDFGRFSGSQNSARSSSIATLHGAVVESVESAPRFVLPALLLPPLVLDHAAAQAELASALSAEADRARARGDLAAAAAFAPQR
ncbi:MAG: hypothetical protein EXS13_07570 [Planctomycetes bacterium]|nr:hypothetical protein [Planctomycetota bacterium]